MILLFCIQALTRNLEDALHDDQFAIIVSHLKLKKINYGTNTETLFAVKDTEPKTKFLLMFNHQQNRGNNHLVTTINKYILSIIIN